MPQKDLHSFTVVGGLALSIASILDFRGFILGIPSSIIIVNPMNTRDFLNSLHFLGDIFKPFLIIALNKSINFPV